jgi:homoserine O-acetyltransferase
MSVVQNYSVTGAWLEGQDPGERRFLEIGDLELESGEVITEAKIAYQTWGTLNADKSNAILVNHAMTGWSDVPGWWPSMVGPGAPLDSNKYFIICPNVIGGCQGSTGPSSIAADGKPWGSRFPSVTIRDLVEAEVRVANAFGITRWVLCLGPSLGGMRSLEWAIQYPDRVGAICTIGSSAVATGDQIGGFSIQIRAIKADPFFNNGDYYAQTKGPLEGMGIAHLTYRTEGEMDVRFGRELQGDETGRFAVESYLDHQAQKLAKRFDANTYIALTEAMASHDVGRERGGVAAALASVKVPTLVVSIDTDRLFPPRLQEEIADLVPTAEPLAIISSPFGHDGFLIEVEEVGNLVRKAVNLGVSSSH